LSDGDAEISGNDTGPPWRMRMQVKRRGVLSLMHTSKMKMEVRGTPAKFCGLGDVKN
jgi:hypothetical protein